MILQRLPKKGPKTSRRQLGSITALLCDARAKRVVKIRWQVAWKPLRGGWGPFHRLINQSRSYTLRIRPDTPDVLKHGGGHGQQQGCGNFQPPSHLDRLEKWIDR